ncbi:MAG: hypothetical protein K1X94_25680 [Sandaracinaceae bacterium]|nr:hypothetical protein [Sandaracinaceae bacterium]
MRPALIALALASAALAQDGPSGPLHTDDGHVIRATLASGAIVDLSGPMDASIEGSRARLRHGSGLHASARLVDVEVQLASTVSVAAGSIELSCGAAITARTASRGGVRIDARALSVRLRDVEVPRASIALRGATRPANAICSAPLPERFSAPERRTTARTVLRRTAAGPRSAAEIEIGTYVLPGPTVDGWTELALWDSGILVTGWARDSELEPPSTPPRASGGMGMGEGLIGLSSCRDEDARTVTAPGRLELYASAQARTPIATVEVTPGLELRPGRGSRVALLAMPGVRRIARCNRPIAWVDGGLVEAPPERPH